MGWLPGRSVGLAATWTQPSPLPALLWHALLLGFAALYAYRRPLLSLGIALFYLGHLIESTVLNLEVVYEHRLYLPSIGLYLALALLAYESFHPAREEELGPHPFPKRRRSSETKETAHA